MVGRASEGLDVGVDDLVVIAGKIAVRRLGGRGEVRPGADGGIPGEILRINLAIDVVLLHVGEQKGQAARERTTQGRSLPRGWQSNSG